MANVGRLVIVLAPQPEADLLLADRMISRAVGQGIDVLIAVNKTDLDSSMAPEITEEYRPAGFPVFPVCATEGTGVEGLKEAMKGETCCLAGQSGTGKSTLMNALMGLKLETGEISRKIARGKNKNPRFFKMFNIMSNYKRYFIFIKIYRKISISYNYMFK